MSDYTITTDFSAKDALPADDPDKKLQGGELDTEFDALQVAVNTKYDVTDIATQVQAEAGTDNTTIMTPLRVSNLLNDSGGSGAGIVPDLIALTDPGADRIVFWDESVNAAAFLTASTGLTISGTNITTNDSAIVHANLSGWDGNEHIDHTGVTITAGTGLSYSVGGTDISTNATIDLDITALTEETTIDAENDDIVFYDASATTHRKVPIDSILGADLGDGKWYRNATSALSSTETTLVFNTEVYDSLTRGTYSTTTGAYTAGSAGARLLISATVNIDAQDETDDGRVVIEVDDVEQAAALGTNRGQYGASGTTITVTTVLSVTSGQVVDVRVTNDSAKNSLAGLANTYMSIVELG